MKTQSGEKLSLATKIGYGMGDIYGGGTMVLVGIYYLYFLTDVVKLNPALAGIVVLISKIWDAVNDPLMGIISDRTRTRFGRRRPYILAGIVFIFFSWAMLWYPVDFQSEMWRFAFVLFAYLFFDTVLTMVMTPYNALASELTLDYHERTSLTSIRMVFSMLSSIICAVVPLELVKIFPDVKQGHLVMGATFGLFFALPYIATFRLTRERNEFQKELPKLNLLRSYAAPFKIRSFVFVLLMYLLTFLSMDVVMSIVIYFMSYYLKRGAESNYVLGTLLVVQVAVIPLFYYIARRTSKKTGFIVSVIAWISVMLFSFLITPAAPGFAVYVFAGLMGLATGGVVVMIYSIFPDIPDVDELETGERREGIYAGLFVFARKLSSAFALFLISQAIALAGYVAPLAETADGITRQVQQEQSEGFIMVLRLIFAVVPVALLALCLVFAWRYPLTPEVHGRLRDFLDARRAKQKTDPAREAELKGILV